MRKKVVGTIWIALCLALLSALPSTAQTQEKDQFQKGKVVDVKRQNGDAVNPTGSTDAPLSIEEYRYTVSVQVGDNIYDLQVDTMAPDMKRLLSKGEVVDIIIGGRTARVRGSLGKVTTFPITGKHPA